MKGFNSKYLVISQDTLRETFAKYRFTKKPISLGLIIWIELHTVTYNRMVSEGLGKNFPPLWIGVKDFELVLLTKI